MKTVVEIEWDKPEEQAWLCADNIALALSAYCKNTTFRVREVGRDMTLAEAPVASLGGEK